MLMAADVAAYSCVRTARQTYYYPAKLYPGLDVPPEEHEIETRIWKSGNRLRAESSSNTEDFRGEICRLGDKYYSKVEGVWEQSDSEPGSWDMGVEPLDWFLENGDIQALNKVQEAGKKAIQIHLHLGDKTVVYVLDSETGLPLRMQSTVRLPELNDALYYESEIVWKKYSFEDPFEYLEDLPK